jgi:hypothetical protein
MAIIGIYKDHAVMPSMWKVLARYCTFIQYVGWQDKNVVIYRVQAEGLPEEDVMCSLNISFIPGIEPFVNSVEIYHEWQPLANS